MKEVDGALKIFEENEEWSEEELDDAGDEDTLITKPKVQRRNRGIVT